MRGSVGGENGVFQVSPGNRSVIYWTVASTINQRDNTEGVSGEVAERKARCPTWEETLCCRGPTHGRRNGGVARNGRHAGNQRTS